MSDVAAPSRIIVDQWSPLAHKAIVGDAGDLRSPALRVAPTWVPEDERRRLAAYLVRAAYLANVARYVLPTTTTDEDRDNHREYGDPRVLVDRVVAAVLGQDWRITVDGADDDPTVGPILPPAIDPLPDGADDRQRRIHALLTEAWGREADAAIDEWRTHLDAWPALRAAEAALRLWADKNHLNATVTRGEHDAVGLGDAVYVLWPRANDWPTVTTYDPGFYFPALDDDLGRGDFPTTVHLAWEFEALVDGAKRTFVRRLTFEQADLTLERMTEDNGRITWAGPDGAPLPDGTGPNLPPADTMDGDGIIRRRLPWHGPDDEPVTTTYVFSDGVWPIEAIQAGMVDALDEGKAQWNAYRVDLGVDFCPVIHVPNTPADQEHYGTSVIDGVAQVLDDVAGTDTRTMGGTAFLGAPAIAMSGANAPSDPVITPGRLYGLGENGRMDVLDLAGGVEQLMAAGDRLQGRLWQNAGVPREMLGKAEADATSGVHLALKFAPFAQLVGTLRMTRDPKYRLLLRMAQRMAQVAGVIPEGPTAPARVTFGNFLPANRAETVTIVAEALNAHAMSTQTAVSMLVAAGLPIADAHAEVARIRAENPAAARDLADAVGSETAAAEWMGIEVPATAAPAITLPPL